MAIGVFMLVAGRRLFIKLEFTILRVYYIYISGFLRSSLSIFDNMNVILITSGVPRNFFREGGGFNKFS
jgi:hypothetical protein